MDTQAEVERTTALAALTQSLVRMEALEPRAPDELVDAPELLEENGFRAARDGVRAELLDPRERCAYAVEALAELAVEACRPHARELGCELELDAVEGLIAEPADTAQREIAAPDDDLALVVEELTERFSRSPRAAAGRRPGAAATLCDRGDDQRLADAGVAGRVDAGARRLRRPARATLPRLSRPSSSPRSTSSCAGCRKPIAISTRSAGDLELAVGDGLERRATSAGDLAAAQRLTRPCALEAGHLVAEPALAALVEGVGGERALRGQGPGAVG